MNIEKILTKDVINQTDKNKERVKMSDILQKYKLVHIFCVVNKIHEKNRYDKLIEMFSDFDLHNYYKCMSTTWKDTITDEIIKKYIKSIDYLVEYRQLINLPPKRMSRAELSVILNHRAVLRHISKKL